MADEQKSAREMTAAEFKAAKAQMEIEQMRAVRRAADQRFVEQLGRKWPKKDDN